MKVEAGSDGDGAKTGQKALGYLLLGLAAIAAALGAIVFLYALIFSGGYDQFPRGLGQQAAWWASALGGLAAAVAATYFAEQQLRRGKRAVPAVASLLLAFAGYAVWWLLAEEFRSPY